MQIIVKGKRLQICLLLSCFLLLEYFSYGVFSSNSLSFPGGNGYAASCSSVAGPASAMKAEVYAGSDFMGAVSEWARLNIALTGKTRGLGCKNNYSFSAILSGNSQVGLINYLILSKQIYTHFDSLQIANFLHKKDGMK